MKRIISIALLLSFACTMMQAQDARALIGEDPLRAANIHHRYEPPQSVYDTPAPAGWEPFYISHYGRHGSRYMTSMTPVVRVSRLLDTLSACGMLTFEGERLHRDIRALEEAHSGMAGYLTQRGAREHQGVSQRMFERYPQVFSQPSRTKVMAASSIFPRCIQSMSNFALQLKGNAPQLDISLLTGQRYMDYILREPTEPRAASHKAVPDSVLHAVFDPSHVMSAWFRNPAAVEESGLLGSYDAAQFAYNVYYAGGIVQCLDEDLPSVYDYFTSDELYRLWLADNVSEYDAYCISIENAGRMAITGRTILKDIVEKADEAVAGNDRAADLRFGHDSGLLPLICVMGLEGNSETLGMTEASAHGWYCFEQMPMCSSVQMVFYRNPRSDTVLVKILRNERETSIPALKPFSGPYYKWDELRRHLVEKCAEAGID